MIDDKLREKARAVAFENGVVRNDLVDAIAAALKEVAEEAVKPWAYCPECGSENNGHQPDFEMTHRYCKNCGQEWHLDIDYSKVVRGHLDDWQKAEARLVAYESITPEDPEVKQDLKWADGEGEQGKALARHYRAALVKIKELSQCSGCGSKIEADGAAYCTNCYIAEHPI